MRGGKSNQELGPLAREVSRARARSTVVKNAEVPRDEHEVRGTRTLKYAEEHRQDRICTKTMIITTAVTANET
jgi:hypothetical protein